MRGLGDVTNLDGHKASISKARQEMLNVQLNQRSEVPVHVIRDAGTPIVVDISRENLLSILMLNIPLLKKKVQLCLNMSALEMGEGGGDEVSGRNTAKQQSDIDESAGWGHIAVELENYFTDAIEQLWGPGYFFDFAKRQTDAQRIKQAGDMIATGAFSKNEAREAAGHDPKADERYDELEGGNSPGGMLDAGLEGFAALAQESRGLDRG